MLGAFLGYDDIVRLLLSHDSTSDVNQDTDDLEFVPLLLHATITNCRNVIDFLLDSKYADVNKTTTFDKYQATALSDLLLSIRSRRVLISITTIEIKM